MCGLTNSQPESRWTTSAVVSVGIYDRTQYHTAQPRGLSMARQMKLGLSMRGIGYHAAAWRHPDVPPGAALDYNYYLRNAQAAERGKFDMIFFADGIGIRSRDIPEGSLCRSGYEVAE